jgi:protein-S-isoprenylcysteine O-methyltransferase Ste14
VSGRGNSRAEKVLFSAVVEERTMAKLFPDAYPPSKRATKMLIPYVI